MTEMLAGYELVGRVAVRGPAQVWKARDTALGREVAIKLVAGDDPGQVARLRDEAARLAALDDEHVVAVHGLVEEDGRAYLVEQWIDGATLAEMIAAGAELTTPQALGVVRGALLGLGHVHHRGMVHGDVSTSNIIVDRAGVSRLIDLGTGGSTPAYRSPEVAAGAPATAASDVYAAAAVLVHLLTGTPGHAGLPRVDAGLRPVLHTAMAASPAGRFSDAAALLEALAVEAERTYGPAWWTQAGLAGLVAPGVAVMTGLGAGTGAAGGSASAVAGGTVAAVGAGGRRFGRVPALLGGGALLTAVVVGGVALARSSGGEDAPPPSGGTPVAAEPVVDTTPTPDPRQVAKQENQASVPSGRWRLTYPGYTYRLRNGSTKAEKQAPVVIDLGDARCTARGCRGSGESENGLAWRSAWDGRRLTITRAPVHEPKSACFDTVTGEEQPIAESAAALDYTYRYRPFTVSATGAGGTPTELRGSYSYQVAITFFGTCEESPEDVVGARSDLVLTRLGR